MNDNKKLSFDDIPGHILVKEASPEGRAQHQHVHNGGIDFSDLYGEHGGLVKGVSPVPENIFSHDFVMDRNGMVVPADEVTHEG